MIRIELSVNREPNSDYSIIQVKDNNILQIIGTIELKIKNGISIKTKGHLYIVLSKELPYEQLTPSKTKQYTFNDDQIKEFSINGKVCYIACKYIKNPENEDILFCVYVPRFNEHDIISKTIFIVFQGTETNCVTLYEDPRDTTDHLHLHNNISGLVKGDHDALDTLFEKVYEIIIRRKKITRIKN